MTDESNKFLRPIYDFFKKLFKPKQELEQSVIEEVSDIHLSLDDDYMNRFDAHSLQDFNLLKGREESLAMLEKAFQSWKDTNNPLLMISEPGMGMSSLLHSTTKLYPKTIILEDTVNFYARKQICTTIASHLGIEGDFNSLEEMVEHVKEDSVVIFENIERLFLRKVNGFNFLDEFILFVHATKHKIYWILTINRYSYYYLDRVRDFSSNFSSIIYLKPISNELIREIIDERNVGYQVSYLKPKEGAILNELKDKSTEQVQNYLRTEFFNQLIAFAEGNISRALLFWRKSVRRTNDKTIYVRSFVQKELSDLRLEEVLILEAIMQHNSLSTKEIREVFRNSSKGSKLAIEKLMEKNAIIFKEYHNSAEKEYQINPLYIPVVKSLIRNRLNRNFV